MGLKIHFEVLNKCPLGVTPDEQCVWVEMNRIFQFRDTGLKCRIRGVY